MCLESITEKRLKEEGFGYKVFTKLRRGKHLFFEFYEVKNSPIVKRRRWLRSNNIKIETFPLNFETYRSGFHIFLNRKDAKLWACEGQKVVKVKYRKGHTKGTQSVAGRPVTLIIAKEMLVL